ncbi:hypothetical protein [Nguyenibacter vanlangensis]|uniref:Tail fiber protein n=1 Tax=Nguyenibacter vanlangensis TaxID=1216886 RepID=A0A7Y7M5N9_9PROT|nr:hypothetical protein [Nguyenibacter vanlangensis]NVN09698.1 hypothetical protein [Nguyenibacter vanlangensis]
MKQSDFPTKISVPFASGAGNAYIRQIPTASQISTDPGAASLTDGFPPQTFQPLGSGGTPQDGRDVNGILNMTSAVDQAFCAGNWPQFDTAFATAIGGYPAGAVLAGSTPGQFWVSTADNNTTVPGASGATWQSLFAGLQPALGFTPVQQGGGANQGSNKVYLGWDNTGSGRLRYQIDNTDEEDLANYADVTAAQAAVNPGRLIATQQFTASGTYTAPTGATANSKFRVRGTGGGGGGYYAGGVPAGQANPSGGGSAGSSFEAWFTYAELFGSTSATTVPVTVGAGGGQASNGGQTSIGNAVIAPGGISAPAPNSNSSSVLSSGAPSPAFCSFPAGSFNLVVNLPGAPGGFGIAIDPSGSFYGFSGSGGSGPFGLGGSSVGTGSAGNGGSVGAGGSGACPTVASSGNSPGVSGGSGGAGFVEIECYSA